MLRLEAEVKCLHAAVDQIQVALASPDLNKLSLREQLTQRQVLIPNQTQVVVFFNNTVHPHTHTHTHIYAQHLKSLSPSDAHLSSSFSPTSHFAPLQVSAGGNGELQTAGGCCAAVSECPPATRGGSGQSADLPHGSDSAAGGQPAAAHHHPAVQHPAGRGQASYSNAVF